MVNAIGPERLETERLSCERLGRAHADELVRLMLDPRIARTLWPGPDPPTEADVRLGLNGKVEHWERHGFGMWLLRDRFNGEMVGRGGLQYCELLGVSAVEVGWAIVPERWGQGLATELALASVGVAFNVLGRDEVIAFALPDNLASRRVMEKAGFVYEREIDHGGLAHVLYVLRRKSSQPRHRARTGADRAESGAQAN